MAKKKIPAMDHNVGPLPFELKMQCLFHFFSQKAIKGKDEEVSENSFNFFFLALMLHISSPSVYTTANPSTCKVSII